ncbi:phosphoribosylglycinamide formyltransferase [Limnobacter sp.]|uniref:phosphoribosylglycinamide formyltransferase n=1 Tax=Limnobacter sp. TaxID=2003368 RepID=UPI00351638C2
MQKTAPTIVVLISGRGSNLKALIDHAKSSGAYRIAAVISNRPQAGGLALAVEAGIPTAVLDHTGFEGREPFDAALADLIEQHKPDWVVLAGFMRILTAGFVARFEGRLVNVHPSLLPAFPGLNTHQQALDAGVRVHGVTVHLVTAQLDHGPIVDQAVVPVLPGDTAEDLAQRVLALEHVIYPRAVAALASGQIVLAQGRLQGALANALVHALP